MRAGQLATGSHIKGITKTLEKWKSVYKNANKRDDQESVLDAVRFKTEVLWAQLDALYYAYVEPGFIPTGAFIPKGFKKKFG